jgi:hypothetical protein
MQALIQNNNVAKYPYSVSELKQDNPQVSFPDSPTVELLESWGVYEVLTTQLPPFDPATQRIEEGSPTLLGAVWTQAWIVIALTDEEIAKQQADHVAQVDAQRSKAYRNESDPLFFMSQRGEATHQEWLDKVAEIKARYPA